jgi:hypothetical protein
VLETEVNNWQESNASNYKDLVIERAKLICELLHISYSQKLGKSNFYKKYLGNL